jgi:hypothetical protein
MNNIIENRKKVYQNFPKESLEASLADMVLFYNINETDYQNLIEATKTFLLKSLTLAYDKEFVWTDTFLEDNDELIMNLPNKTPNGIVNPKKETSFEFEKIQIATNKILNNLGVYKHIKKLAIPNLRYKSSLEPETAKNRPYYTSKHHSDAWVGHVGDSIFLIGVLGDIDNNTVEFNEPINVHDNYLDKAETFDEGNTRYERFDYLGTLSKGKLGVMDHACLHRTLVKEGSKPRLSMDIAVMVDSEYSHANGDGFDPNAYSYYDSEDIQLVGDINHYSVKESIKDTTPSTTISLESVIAC